MRFRNIILIYLLIQRSFTFEMLRKEMLRKSWDNSFNILLCLSIFPASRVFYRKPFGILHFCGDSARTEVKLWGIYHHRYRSLFKVSGRNSTSDIQPSTQKQTTGRVDDRCGMGDGRRYNEPAFTGLFSTCDKPRYQKVLL